MKIHSSFIEKHNKKKQITLLENKIEVEMRFLKNKLVYR